MGRKTKLDKGVDELRRKCMGELMFEELADSIWHSGGEDE